MRILGRVVFAMLATFTFWFAIDYAQGAMASRYFANEGSDALEAGEDIFFYGASRDYHQRGALLSVEASGYTLSFYEVASIVEEDDDITVTSWTYIMLRSDEDMVGNYLLSLYAGEEKLDILLFPFRSLNLRVGLNLEQTMFGIETSKLVEQDYTELILYDPEGGNILSETISMSDLDYILVEEIQAYHDQEGKLPFMELSDQNIYPAISHDLSNYTYIMWISVSVYIVVLGLSIYIVFFLRRKHLGKVTPSPNLIKEQHKYKNSDS
jgi:hypothetical protein